jgi:hypothetical protein
MVKKKPEREHMFSLLNNLAAWEIADPRCVIFCRFPPRRTGQAPGIPGATSMYLIVLALQSSKNRLLAFELPIRTSGSI